MFTFKAVAAVMLAALVVHSAAARTGRQEPAKASGTKAFAPKGEGFSVEFPTAPVTQSKTIDLGDGSEMKVTAYLSENAARDRTLAVVCCEIPAGADAAADDLLDGGVSGFVEGAGGKAPAVKAVVLNGHPGREFQFEIDGRGKCRVRMYLANGRLYQVLAAGAGDYATGDAAKTFLESFKLTGPAGALGD